MEWIDKGGYITKQLAAEDDLDCKGCEMQLVRYKPGDGKYSHYHKKKTEIFYCLEGLGRVTFKDREVILKPGVFLIVKPNEKHIFMNEGTKEMRCLMLKTNNEADDTFKD